LRRVVNGQGQHGSGLFLALVDGLAFLGTSPMEDRSSICSPRITGPLPWRRHMSGTFHSFAIEPLIPGSIAAMILTFKRWRFGG